MNNPFNDIAELIKANNAEISEIKRLILTMNTTGTSEDIISIDEVVKLLKIAKPTIYALTSKNEIPFIKREGSRKLIFSRKALLEWVFEGQRKTVSETQNELNQYLFRKIKKRS